MTKEISPKSTKKEILAVLAKTQEQLKRASQVGSSDSKKRAIKLAEDHSTIKEAEDLAIEDLVKNFRVSLNNGFANFEQQLVDQKEKLNTLSKAVAIKEAELQELYEIRKESDTLECLLQSQFNEKESFRSEKQGEECYWKEEIERLKCDYEDKENELKKIFAQGKKEQEHLHQHLERMWKLDHEEKRIAAEKDIAIGWENLNRDKEHFQDLKNKVDSLEAEKAEEIRSSVEKALEKQRTQFQIDIKILKSEKENLEHLYATKLDSLTNRIKELQEDNKHLKTRLDLAQQEVTNVASKAIEGAAKQKLIINQLEKEDKK